MARIEKDDIGIQNGITINDFDNMRVPVIREELVETLEEKYKDTDVQLWKLATGAKKYRKNNNNKIKPKAKRK